MSSRLKTTLRSFATGKDGGIDLVDTISRPQIIVQVKHYVKTNARGLITELKKEVNKVKKLKPKQYYVCCSKELTPFNVAEIYAIFSGYMESESNILTLIEIEDFLKCNPDILDIEKAEILYNHLYFNTKEQEYFDVIKSNKCYWNIIKHKNYNPRIIEFISNPNRYKTISVDEFHNFIFSSLNNPTMVWDDEYEERLQMVDRCLLMVIYSLSNTEVSSHLVKKYFLHRIKDMREIDTTINQFERVLKRLTEAFVKIVDNKGETKLSMINPSVNDYLRYSQLPEILTLNKIKPNKVQ